MIPNKYVNILKESSIVLIVEYILLAAQVFLTYTINHKFGVNSVGDYALLITVAQITVQGLGQSFSPLIRRDLSIKGQNAAINYVNNTNYFRIIFTVVAILGVVMSMPFFSENMKKLSFFLILIMFSKGFEMLNETYFVTYQSLSKYKLYATVKLFYSLLVWINLLLFYFAYDNLNLFYSSQVLLGISFFIFNILVFKALATEKNNFKFTIKLSAEKKELLKEAWPLMVNALIFQASSRLNVIVLYNIIGAKELGIFSILILFSNIFAGVGNSIGVVLISKFTISANNSIIRFKTLYKKSLFAFFFIGLFLAILFLFSVPYLLKFYKLDFSHTGNINFIIGCGIPILFVTGCVGGIFLILKSQIIGVYVSLLVLLLNIPIYIILATKFGLFGGGYAYIITALLQLFLIVFWSVKIINRKSLKIFPTEIIN